MYNLLKSMHPERFNEKEPSIQKAVEQGRQYLESEHQNGHFPSYISASRDFSAPPLISPRETFSTIAIADTALKDHPHSEAARAALQYIENQRQQGQFTFFEDRTVYPPDTDTNALGYSVLLESGRSVQDDANRILDTILAHLLGRGSEMQQTEQWLMETLHTGAYQTGTRYYQSPDSFLHFMGRLTKFPELSDKMKTKLAEQLQQRIKKTEYPLDLAMRTALADSLGIDNDFEKQKLLRLQEQGGSWPADALFRYGGKQGCFGSKALTTAFSIKGLKSAGF
ncbi:MAG: hypothetical protein UU48_C0006G0025 [Candidatus Uhrbacteria bacterium GW2011_GWF2_41_16]|uniref:Uncharacterized protein n=2 Tax=Candidatus Uhriibacteriota TaxID=1752732 RepID=A0A0G0XMG7_9BACT|nr:MAG: hypothetical protein UU35_C0007G0108 [Candidatus Uhrbacteria bacterium GW2011_GWC2_41_11]KKR97985.1 MAG: hypothetical protein UU48_C0006G0025 [Candidatus Uhrbacteria bacterium GW2011_GWF2_41_16]